MVNIRSKAIPAQPRSKNYPTGAIVFKSGGVNTTVINEGVGSIDVIKSGEEVELSDRNIFSSLRTIKEINGAVGILKTELDAAKEKLDEFMGFTYIGKVEIRSDGGGVNVGVKTTCEDWEAK